MSNIAKKIEKYLRENDISEVFGLDKLSKIKKEVINIANQISKKLKAKDIKVNKSKSGMVNIDIINPDLFGDFGKKKSDMKVMRINLATKLNYFPKIDMQFHFKNGLIGDEVIKTAKDAFEAFKDMS